MIDEIPDMINIADYTVGSVTSTKKDKQIKKKSSSRIKSRDIFKTFQPLDSLIINPLIDIFEPIFKLLKFKSKTVGTITIMSFCFSLYFLYHMKNNLVWLFLFLGIFIGFFDKLHYIVTSKKVYLTKKSFRSKTNTNTKTKYIPKKLYNLLNYEHKEMYNILVKLTIFTLLFAILKSNMAYYDKSKTYYYLLVLMSIMIIILHFHTENKIIESKIGKTKKSFNIRENLLIVKKISLSILVLVVAYLFSTNINNSKNKNSNKLLDVFLFNENEP
jgi:hypothetical protein